MSFEIQVSRSCIKAFNSSLENVLQDDVSVPGQRYEVRLDYLRNQETCSDAQNPTGRKSIAELRADPFR